MPRKMRRLAVRSALSAKQAAGELRFVDTLALETIRTKAVVELLNGFNLGKQKTLIVLADKSAANETIARSANNLPNVKTLNAMYLNIRDLLKYDVVLLPQSSLERITAWLGNGANATQVEEAE
jgi:large subunit ribosomal protein L4